MPLNCSDGSGSDEEKCFVQSQMCFPMCDLIGIQAMTSVYRVSDFVQSKVHLDPVFDVWLYK